MDMRDLPSEDSEDSSYEPSDCETGESSQKKRKRGTTAIVNTIILINTSINISKLNNQMVNITNFCN